MSHQRRFVFLFVLTITIMVGISGAVWADLNTWEKRHPVDSLNAVTYGGGLYVAVGNSGRIRTSSDGIAWTTRTSPESSSLTGIAYGNGLYVAVGGGGIILTSSDAVTWTWESGASGTTADLKDIAFGNGIFVAVGNSGVIRISPDGMTWTAGNSGTDKNLLGIAFGGGKFRAVGGWTTEIDSVDGETWTTERVAYYSNAFTDVAYGPYYDDELQFVTVSDSTDYRSITFGATFVRVGLYGKISAFTEGTWMEAASGTGKDIYGITFGTMYVAVGKDGVILTSPDGLTWTIRFTADTVTTNQLNAAARGNNTFAAVGNVGTIVTSTDDGATWTKKTSGISSDLNGITYDAGIFVAVGDTGKILTSSDGTTWTARTSPVTRNLNGITYGNGMFVAAGYSGTILTSTDGITWTAQNSGYSAELRGIAYGNNMYAAVGNSGVLLTSPDGMTWTSRISGTSKILRGITYWNDMFVAVGGSTGGYPAPILSSTDGITWTERTSGTTGLLQGITHGNNTFVSVGVNAPILSSTDGIAWTERTSKGTLYGIAYGNNTFVALGGSGYIYTSTITPSYTLTVTKAGAGTGTVISDNGLDIDCGDDCTETYNEDTWIRLTATPDAGSTFAGWTGDCDEGIVLVDADKTCTATFNIVPAAPEDWTIANWTEQGTADSCTLITCPQPSDIIRYYLEACLKETSAPMDNPVFQDQRDGDKTTGYLSSSLPPTDGGGLNGEISWQIPGTMNPGECFEVTYDVGVKSGWPAGTRIVNTTGISVNDLIGTSADRSVRVGAPNVTKAGSPQAEAAPPDPVQAATGEYYIPPQVDINLGGPLPLKFSRRYGSGLKKENLASSALGDNWLHNFELRLNNVQDYFVDVVYFGGKVITFASQWDAPGGFVTNNHEEKGFQLRKDMDSYLLMDPQRDRIFRFDGRSTSATFERLLSVQDRNGNELTLTYDGSGTLSQVTDGMGRTLAFSYTGDNLTGVTDGTRNLIYSYTSGKLTGFIDAMDHSTTYEYDAQTTSYGPLLKEVLLPLGNSHYTQTYDADGRVTKQQDALGNTSISEYDTPVKGQTRVTDPAGTSSVTHDREKVPTEIQDRTGKTMKFSYDSFDRPVSVEDRLTGEDQGVNRVTYHDETGKPASLTNVAGDTLSFTYTTQDQTFTNPLNSEEVTFTFYNLTRIDYPDGTNEQFTYDSKGNRLTRTDRAGKTWTYAYNDKGQLLTVTNPAGGVTANTYNADATLASTADSGTGTTAYVYDSHRRLNKITHPGGAFLQMTYDLNDHLTSIIDENSHAYTFAYDANGKLASVTDPNGKQQQYAYDLMDRVKQITDRLSKNTAITYDSMSRTASVTGPTGIAVSYGYDPRGWRNGVTIAGKTWQTGYDDEGIVSSNTTPMNNTTTYQSDKLGHITGITNPLNQTTTFTRDSMSRVTGVADPLNRTTTYSYDGIGLLSGVTMPAIGTAAYSRNGLGLSDQITDLNGNNWTLGYTNMGRLSSLADPLSHTTDYSYDTRGRLSQTTYADSSTMDRTYDDAGNVTRRQYTDGLTLQFTYDELNRLLTANGLNLTRDAEGRVTNTENSGTFFGATYDDGGRLKTADYNNGLFTVAYAYDATTGLLAGVTDNLTGTWINFTYDDDRRVTGLTRSNGVDTAYTYDNAGRITRIRDGTIIDLQYTLDSAGQVSSVNMTAPLAPATLLANGTDTFTYDNASQVSTAGYAYDQRGRLTASPENTFSWDGASRLTGITPSTGPGQALAYNGLGDLVTRGDTHYYYNYAFGLNPVVAEKSDSTSQFTRYYVWTPGGSLLYMIDASDGNKAYFYHFDRLGSTLALTDSAGELSDAYAYTPYGRLLHHNGSIEQPFTFVGMLGVRQENDTGSLYHMRARYYDAVTGRFLSRDPAWPQIGDPRQLNTYQYAIGNPVLHTDETGEILPLILAWLGFSKAVTIPVAVAQTAGTAANIYSRLLPHERWAMEQERGEGEVLLLQQKIAHSVQQQAAKRAQEEEEMRQAAAKFAEEEARLREAASRGLFYMERFAGSRQASGKVTNKIKMVEGLAESSRMLREYERERIENLEAAGYIDTPFGWVYNPEAASALSEYRRAQKE